MIKSKGKKGSNKFDFNVAKFREEAECLFDIAACICINFINCTCMKEKKGTIYGTTVSK